MSGNKVHLTHHSTVFNLKSVIALGDFKISSINLSNINDLTMTKYSSKYDDLK